MNESEIIALYIRRDERAIKASEQKYGAYCFSIALNILSDPQDAEECVNDTWLKAWNSIPQAKPTSLQAYLSKITRHIAIDRYRAYNAEKRAKSNSGIILEELYECIPSKNDVEKEVETKELGLAISMFLNSLTIRGQTVFIRRYFFAEPVKSIAARIGISENAVMISLTRTRKKLKKYLDKEGVLK